MSATTMRFGPEWMRKQPAKSPAASIQTGPQANGSNAPAPPGASTYSSLVAPAAPASQGKRDVARPFSYSREEMLRIWKDGGGSSALPIDVERWEGIVKEEAGEPTGLRELSEAEKQLYATSVNSEQRRRQQSIDQTAQDRGKGGPNGLMRRRRGDSTGSEQVPLNLGRKTSWSGAPGTLGAPALQSPRTRFGGGNGFDGVLDRSDNPWVGGPRRRATSGQVASERVEEADEELQIPDAPAEKISEGNAEQGNAKLEGPDLEGNDGKLENAMMNLNLGPSTPSIQNKPAPDLAKILWSYVDPMGNVQGPFPGETMQQWNDQGYFTDNLMMKRVELDSEFKPLSDIKRRAQGPQVFLSLLHGVVPPPGLGPFPGPGISHIVQKSSLDGSRHSSPQAVHRSAFLDSFINPGAIGMGSASPSSSQGNGLTRGPGTPESVAVASRLPSRFATESPMTGRTSITTYSPSDSPAMPQAIRHVHNDVFNPSRTSSFEVHQDVSWQTAQGANVQAWLGSTENGLQQLISIPDNLNAAHDAGMNLASPIPDQHLSLRDASRALYVIQSQPGGNTELQYLNGMAQQINNYPPPQQSRFFDVPQGQPPLSTLNTAFSRDLGHTGGLVHSPLSASAHVQQNFSRQMTPVSPWGVPQNESPRPRPFDSDFPKADNTFVMPPAANHQSSGWDQPMHEIQQQPAPDSWTTGHQANEIVQELPNLTTANVTQHNEDQGSVTVPEVVSGPEDSKRPKSSPIISKVDGVPPVSASMAVKVSIPSAKAKRKGSASAKITPMEQQPPVVTSAPQAKVEPSAPPKTPWASEIDTKPKASQSLNLREIQEMEKKKQETRRAVDRERERAALANAAVTTANSDELQFTTSWGLPTSQTGTRSGLPASRDNHASPSASNGSAPVWTNSAKPVAKTMKEIQEEEEKRKQTTRETMASAAKKVASVQLPKSAASATAVASGSSGGAWSVIGASGKSIAATVSVRPTVVSQASTPAAPVRSTSTTSSTPRSVITAQAPKATPKADSEPLPPSADFLKWMRDSLSGLDNSVRFEDIAQMLLSFPVDPDAATMELIAETVYGSSTVLDGRRFAKEFIVNRKQDQVQQRGSGAIAKFISLADVVKAQPKAAQNDLAGYKVVKKKGKRA